MKTAHPMVHIKWVDAHAAPGWHEKDAVPTDTFEVNTVGWLIRDGEESISVALSESSYSYGEVLTIPRSYIQEMHKLRVSVPLFSKIPTAG